MSSKSIGNLYEKYKRLIYRVCTKYNISGYTTEDIMQEAYFPFLMALKDYKQNNKGYAFTTFLYNRLNWYFIKLANSTKEKALCVLDEYIDEEQSTTRIEMIKDDSSEFIDDVIENVSLKEIMQCINSLPEDEKTFIIEYCAKGKTLKQIAQENNTNMSNVRSTYAKGLRTLRRKMHFYDRYGYDNERMYKNTFGYFKLTGRNAVEEIAINRADADMQRSKEEAKKMYWTKDEQRENT